MNEITAKLLEMISGPYDKIKGAFNIREDGGCAGRQSTENIQIISKTDKPGIDIRIRPGTKGENVYIPACVTHSDVDDLVYNDFYVGEDADVTIIAGCGVHSDGEGEARHNGIHRFFLGKNSKVRYVEKHVGVGEGTGQRVINPVTDAFLEAGSYMEMDTTQIKGVDSTLRTTNASLEAGARMVIREKLMTHGAQQAESDFRVTLKGDDSGVNLISRSVARGTSKQVFRSRIMAPHPVPVIRPVTPLLWTRVKWWPSPN